MRDFYNLECCTKKESYKRRTFSKKLLRENNIKFSEISTGFGFRNDKEFCEKYKDKLKFRLYNNKKKNNF
jgi:hypothetical protein